MQRKKNEKKKGREKFKVIPPVDFNKTAWIKSQFAYKKIYNNSLSDPENFWSKYAKELFWFKEWNQVIKGKNFNVQWFTGAKTNLSYNCLDVHVNSNRRNKAALIWIGEDGRREIYTYQLLLSYVNKFSCALKKLGIKKGDEVAIYTGNTPEFVIALLSCTRIGAVHTVLFNWLNYQGIKNRLEPLKPKILITADSVLEGGTFHPLDYQLKNIINECNYIENIIIHKRTGKSTLNINNEKIIFWNELIKDETNECRAEELNSNHPLFNVFTSASGSSTYPIKKPLAGYMLQTYIATKWVFDLKEDDLFWNSVNPGWLEGFSYSIYGTFLNGSTSFMYEGIPVYPDASIYWKLIEEYKITKFCTSPNTVRTLRELGNDHFKEKDLSSLRLIATIGDQLEKENFNYLYKNIGKEKIPVVVNCILPETGIITSNIPGAIPYKEDTGGVPLPGFQLSAVNDKSSEVKPGNAGYIIIKKPWLTFFSVKEKTNLNYFNNGLFTFEAGNIDNENYINFLGRVDNVMNISGFRICTDEIIKVLIEHKNVVDAFILTVPDKLKGEGIAVFVQLEDNVEESLLLKEELRNFINDRVGIIAKPDYLIFVNKISHNENYKVDKFELLESLIRTEENITLNDNYKEKEKLKNNLIRITQ